MGSEDLCFTIILMLMCTSKICAGQNNITMSIFTVTSESMTVRWNRQSNVSSYKLTAIPKDPRQQPVFMQFSRNTVLGSMNSLFPNTVYTMRVDALDSSVNVLSRAQTQETTAPEVPSIMQTHSNSKSITVNFREVPGTTGYILRTENNDGFFSESEVRGSPATVLNLTTYTNYTLSVMSRNSGGRSQPSCPVYVRTVIEAPLLRSVSPTEDSIVVSWDPVDRAILYTLDLIKEGSDSQVQVNTLQTNMTFRNLDPGVVYCIRARAWDPNNFPGDEITIYQITRPPVPAGVQVSLTLERITGLAVYWEAVRGASLYFALSSLGQNCTSMGVPFCIISPIGCSENHTLTVLAENQAGPSSPSQPQDQLTFPCPPDSVAIREPSLGNCSVTWTGVPWVSYYIVYISRDDGTVEQYNTTSTTCYFHCDCGYTYMTTVFVYNVAGASPPGPIINYTTVPCCPQNVHIYLVSTETLEVTWPAVRGAELYETVAADGSERLHCSDTMPICVLSDLTCNSLYSVVVRPCSEIHGCNNTCTPSTQETAPCAPELLNLTQVNSSALQVFWRSTNKQAIYTASAFSSDGNLNCSATGTSCGITNLLCGATYEISVYATTTVGRSLPSYSIAMETEPCCPRNLSVEQVTQSMTSVMWSSSKGGWSYITSLSSPRGYAKCHTMDSHCLMGCITCGTTYNVSVEAISITGHKTLCNYHGFSSSACCPSGVRLYRMVNSTLRVYWRGGDSVNGYSAELYSSIANYTCRPALGVSSCDMDSVLCGNTYSVVVAPLTLQGARVLFCPRRLYSVSCVGDSVGLVAYRGKRSVE